MSSKAEYLKRYMSDVPDETVKKKRKKKKLFKTVAGQVVKVKQTKKVVIHDDDASWEPPPDDDDEDGLVGIIDGSKAMADAYGDKATVFNPDEIIRETAPPEFRGKKTFQSLQGDAGSRQRHESSDEEPTRRQPAYDDHSPPRRARHDSDDDNADASPPRRRARHDSDNDDNSPPRRRARHDSDDEDDGDAAPPRRQRHDSDAEDASPPRRRTRQDSDDDDASPPRRRPNQASNDDDDDASPPRRRQANDSDDDDNSPPRATRGKNPAPRREIVQAKVEAPEGGLVSAAVLARRAAENKAKLNEEFARMGANSGIGAETTMRDKTGKRMNPKLEKLRLRQEEMKKMEAEERRLRWGGESSQQAKEDKIREDLITMQKPLARTVEDEDLNELQRNKLDKDDPMYEYMLKQQEKKQLQSGKKVVPRYKGQWKPNRYNIPPGYLWDGVDRSNGFEDKWFKVTNQSKANAHAAYKWSSEAL
eukprot:m.25692 g.25692  ORF g.25692 m.25692 type:complete len:477 (-) comp15128_c0_seq1:185-1615(-)